MAGAGELDMAMIITYLACFLGVWSAIMFALFSIMEKGGDLKPVAWLLLFAAIVDGIFAIGMPTALGAFPHLMLDVVIALSIEVVSCILLWLGLRFVPRLVRPGTILLLIVGVYIFYASCRYALATMGIGVF